jgi:hypothetical protein
MQKFRFPIAMALPLAAQMVSPDIDCDGQPEGPPVNFVRETVRNTRLVLRFESTGARGGN